ncbi:unnamed protein product [Cladocopium goreaui]|uniref:Uncharacterized protein n=1 Tax=Cladocopium goreaui TaxID=2562237 RepID=A0A9P1DC45_9DINO|nr:unnamed protein product [Cladocopium goreaui]
MVIALLDVGPGWPKTPIDRRSQGSGKGKSDGRRGASDALLDFRSLETRPQQVEKMVPAHPFSSLTSAALITQEQRKIEDMKIKREEVASRKTALLANLTNQIKAIMAKISDASVSEAQDAL